MMMLQLRLRSQVRQGIYLSTGYRTKRLILEKTNKREQRCALKIQTDELFLVSKGKSRGFRPTAPLLL